MLLGPVDLLVSFSLANDMTSFLVAGSRKNECRALKIIFVIGIRRVFVWQSDATLFLHLSKVWLWIWFVNEHFSESCVIIILKSLVLISFLYNKFFALWIEVYMPLVNQGLDELFFSLWLSFVTATLMSSSFIILSRKFLYDRSTSCLQSENKLL